jgi:hypothetical protein
MHKGKLLPIIDREVGILRSENFCTEFYYSSFIVRTNTLLTEIIGSSVNKEAKTDQADSY